ncbi:MAG: PAS domain S-box protein [Syntrophomonadaceae bacterium]
MARPAKKRAFTNFDSSINPSFNYEPLSLLSAEGYATAFHRNPNATVICSIPDGRYIEVNDAWVENSGFKREEAIGRTALDLNIWVSLKEREETMAILRSKGSVSNREVRFRNKSGSIKICLFSADVLSLAQGTYMLGVFRDISQLKQTDEALRLSQEKYSKAFQSHPEPMSINTIPDGVYVEVNEAYLKVTGYTRDEVIGRSALELGLWISEEERDYWVCRFRAHKHTMRGEEIRFCMKNGDIRTFIFSTEMINMGGAPHMLWSVKDITERKAMEEALRISEDKFSRAFNISPIPMLITNLAEGRFVAVNEALCRVVGYAPDEILNRTSFEVGIWDSKVSRKPLEDRISNKRPVREMDFTFCKKDGEERVGLLSAEAIEIGGEVCILSTVQDITERRKAEREIRYLSTHDPLTCLYNRAYFEEQLKTLDKAKQLPISIIIADVNGLKMVNDALGHEKGDLLLKAVAGILAKSCRPIDIVARWGGDEFIILLTHCSHEAACLIMEQVKAACNFHHNLPAETSVSLGMATMNHESQNIQNIIIEAEDKMFRRKLLENKSARSAFIISLEKTLWTRSHETREHCQRLEDMALAIGRGINLPNTELDNLKLLASLHDIGKIAVPNNILEKPGKLSRKEWETIRKHPEIGYRIAVSSPEMAPIAEAILHHHERWDGRGYPLGFKGEEIPLLSRIIAIADAYDVMVNGRPYQTPINPQKAWEEIERCAGTQFDPILVAEALKLFVQTVGQV